MDKADCSRTPKIEAKERVNNLGLPCGAPYGLDPLDHGRSDRNWNSSSNRPKNNCSAQLQGHTKNNSNTTVLKHSVVKPTVGFRSILLVPNLHPRFKCCSLCLFWHVLPNDHFFILFCTLFLYTFIYLYKGTFYDVAAQIYTY